MIIFKWIKNFLFTEFELEYSVFINFKFLNGFFSTRICFWVKRFWSYRAWTSLFFPFASALQDNTDVCERGRPNPFWDRLTRHFLQRFHFCILLHIVQSSFENGSCVARWVTWKISIKNEWRINSLARDLLKRRWDRCFYNYVKICFSHTTTQELKGDLSEFLCCFSSYNKELR